MLRLSPTYLSLALLSLLGGALEAAAPAEGAPAGRTAHRPPRSLAELGRRLDKLVQDMALLRAAALEDPDEMRIRTYERYSIDQLGKRKRAVQAEDLLRFMVDSTKGLAARKHALQALKAGPKRGDVDISPGVERGRMSERGYFGTKRLVTYLTNDDPQTRSMTNELLRHWWPVSGAAPQAAYHADKPKTWKPAVVAWKKDLRKRK
jgi:hypothetical protein